MKSLIIDFKSFTRFYAHKSSLLTSLWIFICLPFLYTPLLGQKSITELSLEGLEYRLLGPSRGGRSTAVVGFDREPFNFLMGTTGGGLWQTNDAGQTWKNISDGYFNSSSIGAIAVAPSDPNTIYVGTGSASPRGNVSIGDGVYKSANGGYSWKHIGLKKAGQIGKIIVAPNNPDLVYVAVHGQIFGASKERGVYRSNDGGSNWEKILFVSDTTGAIDLALNPQNPKEIYAAFWRAERKPWTLIDGGLDGGIWKTVDGGDNWSKLKQGLPTGLLGRIGLAISPANPKRVWALIQAKEESKGGLYRTDDGGENWKRINRDHKLRQRGWYYTHLTAHPTNENIIFANNVQFWKSIDGGKQFDQKIRVPHGDCHDLWINPENPEIMIHANDGGGCVTLNGGQTWTTQNNQPTSEFYRVTVDNDYPYRVYGAQQDNTTISVPSRYEPSLTPQEGWFSVGGGESGHIAVDPRDANLIYAGTYIGQITRKDRKSGHVRDVVAYPQMHDGVAPRDIKYRFQWNAPIRISPHNPDVVYHCSQYVHRTQDGGKTWELISPDLTTNNDAYHDIPGGPIQHDHTGVELYTTVFAFEESPLNQGELWAGSDDGRLHLSMDNGQNWQEITPSQIPVEGTINSIELSRHDPARAIITVYKYRENDFKPYIFLTNNYGKNWSKITNGIPDNHFVRVVREDPMNKSLLFAGTEFGMYLSLDEGVNWRPFQQNLPITPITDMAIKDDDLVVATQGRSFWLLDKINALRELSEAYKQNVYLFKPAKAYRAQFRNPRGMGAPDLYEQGAIIDFYLKNLPESGDTLKIFVKDKANKTRRVYSNYKSEKEGSQRINLKKGLNRIVWDLKYESPKVLPKAVFSLANTGGIKAPTGTHSIVLSFKKESQQQRLILERDPRWSQSDLDLQAQYELTFQVKELLNECHETIKNIRMANTQIQDLRSMLKESSIDWDVKQAIEDKAIKLVEKLKTLEAALIQSKSESNQDPINFPPMFDDQVAYLYSVVNAQDDRPTRGSYDRFDDLNQTWIEYKNEANELLGKELSGLNKALRQNNVGHILIKN